jgi:acyl phosphate:glycerol-3-phosphate acyltransferase
MSGRRRARRWSPARSLLALSLAFVAGSLPSARLMTRSAGPEAREDLSRRSPGASSINRVMGRRAGVAVLTADVLKGYLPATLGRAAGAGPLTVEALALAPMAGHILVVKGRGGAALAGGVVAVDPLAFVLLCPIWVGATLKKDNARGVLVACLFYPVLRRLLGRSTAAVAVTCAAPVAMIYARLRGPGWGARPLTPALLWRRLTYDAELEGCDRRPPEVPAVGAEV